MKTIRLLLTLILTLVSYATAMAQYTNENSLYRKAITLYQRDKYGMYIHKEDVWVDTVQNVTSIYAYNKEAQNLYVRTENGNYVIMLDYDHAKLTENDNNIPQLSENEINAIVANINEELKDKFTKINEKITKEAEAKGIIQASFPGGEAKLLSFISQNLVYPPKAYKKELQGTVVLRFQVKGDGNVGKIKIEKSLSSDCDKAAIAVVKKLPKFNPAKLYWKPVPVWFRLPIRFRIQ